jgi:outer membrane receptor protein involved in Fe transport
LQIAVSTILGSATLLIGQDEGDEANDVFELSPFTVSTSSDSGYIASNTLAGSRLNTALEDTAAPITVFTKDLLQDLAANDTQTATFYSVNAEEFVESELGDLAGNQLQNDGLQFNIRGFQTTATRNYFPWGLNTDNYNADRIDYSRGPNSILYGLGSPGGVVNTSTKQAQMNSFYGLELQASSWDGRRAAVDLNQEVVEDILALRFNGMVSRKESWRRTRFKDEERFHLAATFRPFSKTVIRAEFEDGTVDQVKPRPWGPLDGFSAWEAAGSIPVATARGEIPAGAAIVGGSPRLTINQTDGFAMADWGGMARSESPAFNYAIFDFDRVPRSFAAIGDGNRIDTEYDTYSIYLEQEILENLFVELAYNHQSNESLENRPINWNAPLTIDINQQLPDGSANPNFGRFYVEDSYRRFDRNNETDIFRATASYELDFGKLLKDNAGKWLGRHRLAGLYQQQEDDNRRFNYRELNATPLVPTSNWTAASNRIFRRTYIDFDAGIGLNGQIAPQFNPVAPQTVTIVDGTTGTVTPEILPDNFIGSITEVDTEMFALQSYFWNDRIVTTYGRREDSQRSRGPTVTRENRIITDYVFDNPFGDERSGTTETKGVVFHALDWLSVFYNESESFNLGNPSRFTLDGRVVGDEKGIGEDYGVRFSFLEDRLFVSVSRYETSSTNRLTFNAEGDVQTAANAIWEAIDPSREILIDGGLASTENLVSEGTEFEVVANITRNWKLIANLSKSETKTSGLFARNRAYVEDNRDEWMANAGTAVEGGGLYTTVGEAVAFIDQQIAERVLPFNNQMKRGHSDLKVNLFTDYTFGEDTPLDGFSVGGGLRHVSEPVIGYSAPVPGTPSTKYEGDANTLIDLKIGYKTTIYDGRIDWSIQLNVRNVLDEDDILLTLADADGNPRRYRFQEPREWVITTSFRF